jgi:hypothetical protein
VDSQVTNSVVETKVASGSASYLIAGYAAWALFQFVPWLETNLPGELKTQLPVIIAWFIGTAAAYRAPHTHRDDLMPPVPLEPRRQEIADAGLSR